MKTHCISMAAACGMLFWGTCTGLAQESQKSDPIVVKIADIHREDFAFRPYPRGDRDVWLFFFFERKGEAEVDELRKEGLRMPLGLTMMAASVRSTATSAGSQSRIVSKRPRATSSTLDPTGAGSKSDPGSSFRSGSPASGPFFFSGFIVILRDRITLSGIARSPIWK